MTDDRCKHDMLPGTCSWCKGIRDSAVEKLLGASGDGRSGHAADLEVGGVAIEAEYRTQCLACEGWIEIGEEIVNSEVGWVHADHMESQGGFTWIEGARPATRPTVVGGGTTSASPHVGPWKNPVKRKSSSNKEKK